MELQALGYFGIRARNLDDWTAFATRLVGFELVEKSKSSLTFRMDDRQQRIIVDADGSVAKVDVLSEPGQGLGAAGARAIRSFRFRPGKLSGTPVATTITYTLHFVLD